MPEQASPVAGASVGAGQPPAVLAQGSRVAGVRAEAGEELRARVAGMGSASSSASASSIKRATSSSVAVWPTLAKSAAGSAREIRPSPFASNLRKTRSISSPAVGGVLAGEEGDEVVAAGGPWVEDWGEEDLEEERWPLPLREKRDLILPMDRVLLVMFLCAMK